MPRFAYLAIDPKGAERRGAIEAAGEVQAREKLTQRHWHVVRLGPDDGESALLESHVKDFDITGRAMKGWVMIEPEGVEDDGQLKDWIQRATKFGGTLPKK